MPSAEKAYIAGAKAHQFDHPAVVEVVECAKDFMDALCNDETGPAENNLIKALREFEKARKAGGGK